MLTVYYATLEEWAADADPAWPVYAVLAAAPAGEAVGGAVRLRRHVITVGQVRPPLAALYHLRLSLVEEWSGQKATNENETLWERDRALWEMIVAWLTDHGFPVRHGLIVPGDGVLPLDGELPGFVGYDRTNDRFYRK